MLLDFKNVNAGTFQPFKPENSPMLQVQGNVNQS